MSLQSSPTTAKTHPSSLGADEHAPLFSLMRMESAAAEREREALASDLARIAGMMSETRATMLRLVREEAARTKEQRERAEYLERQLAEEYAKPRRAWLVAAVASFAFWGGVMWVVTR